MPAPQDAIALLKADHREAEALFEKFEHAESAAERRKIVEAVCTALVIHTMIEEEIFYPALRGKIEDGALDEAYVEHDGAKVMITELQQSKPGDAFYAAKVKVLSEEIKHHVHEEEMRAGLFAKALKTDVDMKELGAALAERKQALSDLYEKKGAPAPQARTLHAEMKLASAEA